MQMCVCDVTAEIKWLRNLEKNPQFQYTNQMCWERFSATRTENSSENIYPKKFIVCLQEAKKVFIWKKKMLAIKQIYRAFNPSHYNITASASMFVHTVKLFHIKL